MGQWSINVRHYVINTLQVHAETQRDYSPENRKVKKREVNMECLAYHKRKITKTDARVQKYTVGAEVNASAVGKATRRKYGYAEDSRVNKERLVH